MRSLSAVHPDICLVDNNNCSKCGFTPESCGSSRLIKHCTSHLLNRSVHPFHYSILLRSPSCREFPSYSMLFTEVEKFIWGKLPASIRPEAFDFVLWFILNQGFEWFELFKGFIFVLHKSYPTHRGEFVNEYYKVFFSSRWPFPRWTTYISMDKFKWPASWSFLLKEVSSGLLTKLTWFSNCIVWNSDVWKTTNCLVFTCFPYLWEAKMPQSFVP